MMRIEIERPLTWPIRPVETSAELLAPGPSILIVGHNLPAANRVRESFARNGHHIQVTCDIVQALDTLETDASIGVVVVQMVMPHFDGLALVERMQSSLGNRSVQFIILASGAQVRDVVRAIHLKVVDFVDDPEDFGRLHGALVRALSVSQTTRDAPAHDAALDEAYRHGMAMIAAVKALRERHASTARHSVTGTATPSAPAISIVPMTKAKKPVPIRPESDHERLRALRALQQWQASRDKFFPKDLFEDPCWAMLLDLMTNHLLGKRISVSSLCMASGVAQTTALRRISNLKDCGLIRRVADDQDGRRVFVELTDEGIAAMSRYIEHIQSTNPPPFS
ncbi:two-component response regulator (plasmid) [Azospirillum sp. B510]|uniref:response regulator n=2 Tax=Alphaproteobacteria TaxID=28211 RepID=UPI0001C4B8E5|nr:response regulator [Azospirillum sp. B510]BAI73685.1 two-component response regulator [Azospirillum sp. B510]